MIAQLEDRACRFSDDPNAPCTQTPIWSAWLHRLDPLAKYRCALGAARCLESMGPRAAHAVPALVKALREGPNDYDTGDGVIAPRSAIAGALGAIGDPRAVGPLAGALRNAVPADRGAGAIASREPAARHALVEALGRFGHAAGPHWELIAAVLRERNSDSSYLEQQREQYERSAATELVVADLKRRNPEATSYAVPPAEIEMARRRLDRSSSVYVREFEWRVRDPLASAAARALGRLGRAETVPLLIATLRNPPAAEAAAGALAELGQPSTEVGPALRGIVESRSCGPSARSAAARALGRLGDERSAILLARGLSDSDLCEACASGLKDLGPRARAALPALKGVLEQPSMAEHNGRGLFYSVEATRQLGYKIAAVRAIESIAGAQAIEILTPYLRDPDIGSAVRSALRRIDPRKSHATRGQY